MADDKVTRVRRWDAEAPVFGLKPHTLAVSGEINERTRLLRRVQLGDMSLEIKQGREVLWLIARWAGAGGIALRGVYSPDGDVRTEITRQDETVTEMRAIGTTMGEFRCRLEIPDPGRSLFRWSVGFAPAVDILMPPQPWNVYPIDEKGNPVSARGIVHAAQRGSAAGVLYFTITQPRSGSVLYFQNLTALNEYCERTRTTPNTIVGEEWPNLGYLPPPSDRNPLPARHEVSLCDAFVCLSSVVPENDRHVARLFLEHLAAVYRHLPRPPTEYHDWPRRAEETLRDLTYSAKCTVEHQGYTYLHPYTASEYPDSMVQLTVLLPMREYGRWAGREIPLASALRSGIRLFFDPKIGAVRRYLATVGPDKNPNEVDSWYQYHPLTNLARLAQEGDEEAKWLFLSSVEHGIKVAHHFEYWWPVQFDIETLEVLQGDRKPGEAGQTDVPGLYAYVMLKALDLTGDCRFLEEAKKAICALKGLSFNIGYQFNNVGWGAMACLRLWKLTGDPFFLEQSHVFLASFFHNTVIWECDFGPAKHYPTFMGVTCLHDGNYMAMYEEYEAFTAFHECLDLAGDDLSPDVRLLLNEYCRYALSRGWYYYPSELPRDSLAKEVRNGHIDRSLAIPLEDLYAGWEPAGAVGQEIYGSGAAFAFVTRAYRRIPNAPFMVFCEYRIAEFDVETERCVAFEIQGDSGFSCRVRLIPLEGQALPDLTVRVRKSGGKQAPRGTRTPEGHLEYELEAGSTVIVDWRPAEMRQEDN